MNEKYQRYNTPVAPADPNQEFMDVRETAHVLKCSVPTVRRRLKELGIKSKVGKNLVTSRQDRLDIQDAGRVTPLAARRSRRVPRQRRALAA